MIEVISDRRRQNGRAFPFGAIDMKKRQFTAAVSALLGATLLISSCSSGSAANFSANWHANTAINTVVEGTSETLVYNVTQNVETATNSTYSVHYSGGTYTAALTTEQRDGKLLYRYHTELSISVQYLFDGQYSEPKTDKITSTVYFRSIQEGLAPVSSTKEVESRSPSGLSPASLDSAYRDYHYSIQTDYNEDGTAATSVYTDLSTESGDTQTTEFSIGDGYSYIDNEELLFALRGISYASAQQFQVYNASVRRVQNVRVSPSSSDSDEFEFSLGGQTSARAIEYYPLSISISESNPGATQTAWYAATTSASNNVYRNVMLRLETPISYNLGSLVYELQSAEFATT